MATQKTADNDVLQRVAATIAANRHADPVQSYVATMFAKGDDAIIKKIGEEATEVVMAAKDGDKIRLTAEVADLWFECGFGLNERVRVFFFLMIRRPPRSTRITGIID